MKPLGRAADKAARNVSNKTQCQSFEEPEFNQNRKFLLFAFFITTALTLWPSFAANIPMGIGLAAAAGLGKPNLKSLKKLLR